VKDFPTLTALKTMESHYKITLLSGKSKYFASNFGKSKITNMINLYYNNPPRTSRISNNNLRSCNYITPARIKKATGGGRNKGQFIAAVGGD
jgi:hypothetical protein